MSADDLIQPTDSPEPGWYRNEAPEAMTEETILTNLRRIMDEGAFWIRELQNVAPIEMETRLEDIDLDAGDLLQLMLTCEEEFGIEVRDEDYAGLVTVGDIVALINREVARG